jgi:hypothetical protein
MKPKARDLKVGDRFNHDTLGSVEVIAMRPPNRIGLSNREEVKLVVKLSSGEEVFLTLPAESLIVRI